MAQNLVPNHSFEEFVDGCPETFNGTVALGWENWSYSPDLFSTCVDPQNFNDSLGWVPSNGWGYQWPADGETYAGLYAHGQVGSDWSQDYREYIGCELLEPLEVGQTYYVSFKTSMAFGNYYYPIWACNRLGAYFTTQGYHWEDNPLNIPNFAHVYGENIIADTVNWVTVSGSFMADQPYTHMGLGVFFEFALLDTMNMEPGSLSLGSYYYIDDACVSRFPDCTITTTDKWSDLSNDIQIYPNPANTQVVIESTTKIVRAGLRNLSGKWVKAVVPINHNRVVWPLSDIPSGIYIIVIESTTGIERKKLVVAH